jgi:hypothetical protein
VKRNKPPQNGTKPGRKTSPGAENARPSETRNHHESAKSPRPTDAPVSHDRYPRPEAPQTLSERKRLFLRVGDEVSHRRYEQWGIGVVMETMTSSVPGGTCLARIRFQDGQLRCFNNDLDNESCCYYFGVRRYWNPTHGVDVLRSKFFAMKG